MFKQDQPIGRIITTRNPLEKMTGDQFRNWRVYMNLTQEQMAKAIGVHFITISRWERRKWRALAPMAIRKVANAIDPKINLPTEEE